MKTKNQLAQPATKAKRRCLVETDAERLRGLLKVAAFTADRDIITALVRRIESGQEVTREARARFSANSPSCGLASAALDVTITFVGHVSIGLQN